MKKQYRLAQARLGVMNMYWERTQFAMYRELGKKRNKTKKEWRLFKNIMNVSTSQKNEIIKKYLHQCKIKYLVAINEWHDVYKAHLEQLHNL